MTSTIHRETLLARLCEAAEVEHNLMCVYLYAAFSLKTGPEEGLSPVQLMAVNAWRTAIFKVAHEEMTHLLLVSNLLTALGGAAHFGRMNFPIPPGSLPADMQVRLAPFNRDTLQHMIWLERPPESEEPMGNGFAPSQTYLRGAPERPRLMPHATDYATVGALYAQLEADLDGLAARIGEDAMFIGAREGQIGHDLVSLPGVTPVLCLKTAHQALRAIVAQGEGAPNADAGLPPSHFQRFCAIRAEYDALLADDPHFTPARPAAHNPVMRRPPTPEGKVWIEADDAAEIVDLANALYAHMLRLLVQAFGRASPPAQKAALLDAAIDLMFAISPTASLATRLPANGSDATCTAGMSFATLRSFQRLPEGVAEWTMLAERLKDLADGARSLAAKHPDLGAMATALATTAARFGAQRSA